MAPASKGILPPIGPTKKELGNLQEPRVEPRPRRDVPAAQILSGGVPTPDPASSYTADFCCVGFNPETSVLEAVFWIDRSSQLGLDCSPGSVAHVGFWLQFPPIPGYTFVGEAKVRVFGADYPGSPTIGKTMSVSDPNSRYFPEASTLPASAVYYSVQLLLTPDQIFRIQSCQFTAFPDLYCVLSITGEEQVIYLGNQNWTPRTFEITDANFGGSGLTWYKQTVVGSHRIQFPKRSTWGAWEYLGRDPLQASTDPIHVVHLKNKKLLMFAGFRADQAGEPAACLFDPASNTFQAIPAPNTHFLTWAVPKLPVLDGAILRVTPDGVKIDIDINGFHLPKFPFATAPMLLPLFNPQGVRVIEKDKNNNNILAYAQIDQGFAAKVHDTFCSGQSALADGRVIVVGGQERTQDAAITEEDQGTHTHHDTGLRQVSIYDPDTNAWSTIAPASRFGRWYPSTLVDGKGHVYVVDGHTDSEDTERGTHTNMDLEIFDPVSMNWIYQAFGNPSYYRQDADQNSGAGFYPRLMLLPDGSIFYINRVNEYVPDPSIAGFSARYLPSTGLWIKANSTNIAFQDVDSKKFDPTKATGVYADQHTTAVLMPLTFTLRNNRPIYLEENTGVMLYSTVAGADGNAFDGRREGFVLECYPLARSAVIPNQTAPFENWFLNQEWLAFNNQSIDFTLNRYNGNSVLLPDGTIMFVGGTNPAAPGGDILKHPNLRVDIFDPVSRTWTSASHSLHVRDYHSFAILLFDGRVLLGGTQPPQVRDMEIFTPDYLWRGPRPVFTVATAVITRGMKLEIMLGKGWKWKHIKPDKCALIRCHGVTHAFGNDQRYVNLHAVTILDDLKSNPLIPPAEPAPEDESFRLEIPSNESLLPPGYYMLFIFSRIRSDGTGAPSDSQIIRIV